MRADKKWRLNSNASVAAIDLAAIHGGFSQRKKIIQAALFRELKNPRDSFEEARLNLLSNLIAVRRLDFKIAMLEDENKVGMFHEKLGLMQDAAGNVIAFSGSMNESANAFANNYEAIDVFTSWTYDAKRVETKAALKF